METEKELVVFGTFYLKMKNGETQKEAEERFINKLEDSGIDWLDTFESEVQDY